MSEYPKTENLYRRDPDTHYVGPENGFRLPEVATVGKWLVLDKLDGMNMRVTWTHGEYVPPMGMCVRDTITVAGRTDAAQIPGDLLASINAWAKLERFKAAFEATVAEHDHDEHPAEVILYGEGIGPGIQGAAGQAYGGDKRFVLFDVAIRPAGRHRSLWWLRWDDVVDIAWKMGIGHALVLARDVDLETAKWHATHAMRGSYFTPATLPFGERARRLFVEGGILRTDPYIFTQRGSRVTAKYKARDLAKEG